MLVVHLSDVHFGDGHRFDPPRTPHGDIPSRIGYPTLTQKLLEDLSGPDPGCPVAICITGDLVTAGTPAELAAAETFVRDLAAEPILGKPRGLSSIFLVPGNHDIHYESPEIGARWRDWIELHNRLYGLSNRADDPWALAGLHNRMNDLGAVILCLNSAIYVEKDEPDQDRGQIDVKQLTMIEDALRSLPRPEMKQAIRLALIHHHPVLIPALAEPGRGYDAVENSGKLLSILRRYGFHLILHGHKHNPHVFTEDSRSAFLKTADQPIFIAAGGSIGSKNLPDASTRCNSYNRITMKWHPDADQLRIAVDTRALDVFDTDGTEALPDRWTWHTLKMVDRSFTAGSCAPTPKEFRYQRFSATWDAADQQRREEYARLRGNLPVVEVLPSLDPSQAYEARLWIVGHNRSERDIPMEVTWLAGKKFPTVTITKEQDTRFCTAFDFWGPMLVQANLKFADGTSAHAHIYARMPENCE